MPFGNKIVVEVQGVWETYDFKNSYSCDDTVHYIDTAVRLYIEYE